MLLSCANLDDDIVVCYPVSIHHVIHVKFSKTTQRLNIITSPTSIRRNKRVGHFKKKPCRYNNCSVTAKKKKSTFLQDEPTGAKSIYCFLSSISKSPPALGVLLEQTKIQERSAASASTDSHIQHTQAGKTSLCLRRYWDTISGQGRR